MKYEIPWHTVYVIAKNFNCSELGWDTGRKKGCSVHLVQCLRYLKDIWKIATIRTVEVGDIAKSH